MYGQLTSAQYNAFLTGILLWNLKEFHCHQLFPILISEIFRIIKYWLYYILGWLKTVNSEKIRRFYTFRSQWSFDECYSNSYSFPNITTFATFQVLLTGSNNQFRNYESRLFLIFDQQFEQIFCFKKTFLQLVFETDVSLFAIGFFRPKQSDW